MRSVETHVQLSFGWTHEELWLRVSWKSVVAVPMEAAPRARSCRVRGQSTFDRIRQPQTNFIYFIWRKLLERNSFFQSYQCIVLSNYLLVPLISNRNSSTSNFLFTDYLCIDGLNLLSAIRAHNQLRSSQRSQAAKFRIEKDPRRSWCHQYSRPFQSLNSHIFFFVVDQC